MTILTVIPLAKGFFKEVLTYWSAQEIPSGALVYVAVKNRKVAALVLDAKPAGEMKAEVKNSDFSLKKILGLKNSSVFLPEFIAACKKTAEFYAGTLGQTIKAAVPQLVLDNLDGNQVVQKKTDESSLTEADGTIKQNKYILQDGFEERLSYYKALVRESFAKKESVLLCLPTKYDVENYAPAFGIGIKDFTLIFHSDRPAKTMLRDWNRAIKDEHPLLMIATPGFLSIPRHDLKTIIIEKENHSSYKSLIRPHIDFRHLAENLANELQSRLILGDLVLRTETIFRAERGEFAHLSSLKYRSLSSSEQFILNTKNFDSGDKTVYAIGDELRIKLKEIVADREKIAIYCGQKGISHTTVCNDCGRVVPCDSCRSPLVLHKDTIQKKYYYLCHKCGREVSVEDKCQFCGSWRLSMLGAGMEKAEQELRELFPSVPLFRLEGKTKLIGRNDIGKKFYETKGPAILLGTEAILSQLDERIANIAVISIDALFSQPDYRISEKILSLLLSLRQLATKKFIIQTRNPDEKVFHHAATGNLIDFYREEIEERMKFGYPPFKIIIKFSQFVRPENFNEKQKFLEEFLADYSPTLYHSDSFEHGRRQAIHAIIKIPQASWTNARLLTLIKELSPEWIVSVEPDSVV